MEAHREENIKTTGYSGSVSLFKYGFRTFGEAFFHIGQGDEELDFIV